MSEAIHGRHFFSLQCGAEIHRPLPCKLEADPILDHPTARFVRDKHPAFVRAWCDETAHPDYRPLPPRGTTHAYGQCVPSSLWLFKWLARKFPNETFSIESGYVYTRGERATVWSHTHVWLHWIPAESEDLLKDIHVIDITVSQVETRNLVLQSAHDLAMTGLVYQSLRRFHDLESFYARFSIREPDIRDRVERYGKRVVDAYHALVDKDREELTTRFEGAGAEITFW